MSLIEMYDVAQASSFKNRLISCVVATAGAVFAEDPDASASNTVYQKRQTLARSAVMDPAVVAQQFVWPMLSNASIAASGISASDGDLMYQCAQVWNTVAGVTAADTPEPE